MRLDTIATWLTVWEMDGLVLVLSTAMRMGIQHLSTELRSSYESGSALGQSITLKNAVSLMVDSFLLSVSMCSWRARFHGNVNDKLEPKRVADVLGMVEECFIIAHSHGAALVIHLLGSADHEVKTTITETAKKMMSVEPRPAGKVANLTEDVPTLVERGDYMEGHHRWAKIVRLSMTQTQRFCGFLWLAFVETLTSL
jgi:hypothetical protein